jgi:hypothetical protein
MDAANEPSQSTPEDTPEHKGAPVESEIKKPTAVRSSAEVADTVSTTYERLARPGKTPPA